MSGIQGAGFSYISEFHTHETSTRAVTFVTMFMPATFIFLPFLAYTIIPAEWNIYLLSFKLSQWRLYMIASSLLNFVVCIIVSRLPESPKFLLSVGKGDEALVVLRQVFHINTGRPKAVCT